MRKNETFGSVIRAARKKTGLSQVDLAKKVKQEDDKKPISPQYLNDIEFGRRSPSSDHIVNQFAKALNLNPDWLCFLLGKIPAKIRKLPATEKLIDKKWKAFANAKPRTTRRK